ncbi:hypothetical protein SAMN05660199_04129 [Klenkia soli]|uniref:Uncharacterized protein n=1 Tax=Klenkia soli TaxID=1052260 RepID=A0A1H0TFH2_9ACTN|nr:hypothetical protein [Klenkia soli]SDP52420.1 hypothetical protein SAMN05660199_04129 [Klenkia soli]
MSGPLVVPLGRQLAVLDLSPVGALDPRGARGFVQVDGGPVELSGAAAHVWLACHGHAADPAPHGWGQDDATALARRWGLGPDDIAAGWDEVRAAGVVTDLVDDADGRRAWARAHTLHPLVPALGELPDRPAVHQVGLPGQPRVELSRVLRDVWAWGPLFTDLWTGVRWHAEGHRAAGVDEPRVADPDLLLADLVASLRPLLRANAAYVDRAVDGGGAR